MSKCGFSFVDLQNIINIIEVCTKRGSFNAEELSGVGALYDKLKKANKKYSKVEDNTVEKCPLSNSSEGSEKESEKESEKGSRCEGGICPIDKN